LVEHVDKLTIIDGLVLMMKSVVYYNKKYRSVNYLNYK